MECLANFSLFLFVPAVVSPRATWTCQLPWSVHFLACIVCCLVVYNQSLAWKERIGTSPGILMSAKASSRTLKNTQLGPSVSLHACLSFCCSLILKTIFKKGSTMAVTHTTALLQTTHNTCLISSLLLFFAKQLDFHFPYFLLTSLYYVQERSWQFIALQQGCLRWGRS